MSSEVKGTISGNVSTAFVPPTQFGQFQQTSSQFGQFTQFGQFAQQAPSQFSQFSQQAPSQFGQFQQAPSQFVQQTQFEQFMQAQQKAQQQMTAMNESQRLLDEGVKSGRHAFPAVPVGWEPNVKGQRASPAGGKSYLYYDFGEVSSALQKSCRKGLEEEAVQWALDGWFAGDRGSGLRTNVCNRLRVISVEDVGPAAPQVIIQVEQCCRGALMPGQSDNVSAMYIACAASILARAKKTRVNDWMTAVYRSMQGHKIADANTLNAKLAAALEKRDLGEAWFYTDALFQHQEKSVISLFYGQRAFAGNPYVAFIKNIGLDTNWFKSGKHRLLLIHIVNLYTSGLLPTTCEEVKNLDGGKFVPIYEALLARNYEKLQKMPDYAVDKHTSRGSNKLKRDITHFMEVGSKLENVDEVWEKVSTYYVQKYWSAPGQ